MKTVMPVTQVWLSTPVDYLAVPEDCQEQLVDTLLQVEGVNEVEHYSEILVRCDLTSDSDLEAFLEIAAIRSRLETVFRSFRVWPEPNVKLTGDGERSLPSSSERSERG